MSIGVSGQPKRKREPFLEISMIIITIAAVAMVRAGRSAFVAGANAPMLEYITSRNSTSSFNAQLGVDGAGSATEPATVDLALRLNQPAPPAFTNKGEATLTRAVRVLPPTLPA